jgi:hypothetical protein
VDDATDDREERTMSREQMFTFEEYQTVCPVLQLSYLPLNYCIEICR